MVVKCLLLYRTHGGAIPGPADASKLIEAFEKLCAIPITGGNSGQKTVEASCYFLKQQPARAIDPQVVPNPRFMNDIWLMQVAESPNRFIINRLEPRIAEADSAIRFFLERRMEYRPQPPQPMVVQGRRWRLGGGAGSDVIIKLLQIGSSTAAPIALGLELSYAPLNDLQVAAPIMEELVEAVRGALGPLEDASLELIQPSFQSYNIKFKCLPETFSPSHTAVAYAELISAALDAGKSAPAAS